MSMYFSYVTNVGIDKIEAAYNAGETINLIEMAIGDSNGAYVAPDSSFTNLVNEFARVALNEASTDGHLIHVISYIQPTAETAEKTLREYGIYDDEGDMIIYGAYPESLIPSLASAEHLQLEVENITELENADVVNVTVSPIVPHATETEAGIAKIINVDDVEAGVDDSKILTISKMLKRVATSVKAGVARFATSAEAINGTNTSTMLNPSTGLALLKSRISSALDGTRTDYSASESALSQVNAKADNAQSTADSATDLANAAQATADSKWTAQ
ncbi:phage tail protein, partial [Vibrio parahaemolyticus]